MASRASSKDLTMADNPSNAQMLGSLFLFVTLFFILIKSHFQTNFLVFHGAYQVSLFTEHC
jgi:hypothetical protein